MMNQCYHWPISICSWSLRNDFDQINALMQEMGIGHIHLDLRPVCIDDNDKYFQDVQKQNWTISSTMIGFEQEDYSTLETIRRTGGIVPEDCWQRNQEIFLKAIDMTQTLGVKYLSSHIGFIDHSNSDDYKKLLERIKSLADYASEKKVTLLMETGQESAEDLRRFLEILGHTAVGINFDPANMILYDKGNPIEAVILLSPWIRHVHIKDAIKTARPGTWGSEVVWATGEVNTTNFLKTLCEIGYKGTVAVEREAGQTRVQDIRAAIENLIAFKG